MSRFVVVILYEGLVGEIQVFSDEAKANKCLEERRRIFGWEETSGSLIWDIQTQLPVATKNSDPKAKPGP